VDGESAQDQRPNSVVGRPWPKGVSGNPGGRPRGRSITARLRELLDADAGTGDGRTIAEEIARVLLEHAAAGDIKAVREVLDRTEGRPRPAEPEGGQAMEARDIWDDICNEVDALAAAGEGEGPGGGP